MSGCCDLKVQTIDFCQNNGYVTISKMYYCINHCTAAMRSLYLRLKKLQALQFRMGHWY